MHAELHGNGISVDQQLKDYIERRLRFALARFGNQILRTTVYLTDKNGPKGGIDKSCRIVVRLRGVSDVVADVVDVDWPVAVDRATNRIGHSVSRQLERKRGFQRESAAGA